MKRLLLLAGAAALCTLALFAVYCADVKYDNPLDEKAYKDGDIEQDYRWLWEIKEPDCEGLMGTQDRFALGLSCGEYVRLFYFNPLLDTTIKKDWDKKLGCTSAEALKITVVGDNPATLYYNHPNPAMGVSGFQRLMGANGWGGVVTFSEGATINRMLTKDKNSEFAYEGLMPPVGDYYIVYIAEKMKCESNEMDQRRDDRTLKILEYTADDAEPPRIVFSNCKDSYEENETFLGGPLSCVSAGDASTTVTVAEIKFNGAVVTAISTAVPGTFTITYQACKTLIVNGVPNPTQTCVPGTRTITVRESTVPVTLPTPVIVLNPYTYTLSDGSTFSTPEGVLASGENYVEKGVARAFYLDENGVEQPIAEVPAIRKPESFTSDMGTGRGSNVTYTLEAVPNKYARVAVTRMVYRLDGGCNTPETPRFTFRRQNAAGTGWESIPSGADNALVIPKNKPWDASYYNSVTISSVDAIEGGEKVADAIAFRLGVDLVGSPKLDLNNPKPGTYKITYIALSPCSSGGLKYFRSAERTVTVSP